MSRSEPCEGTITPPISKKSSTSTATWTGDQQFLVCAHELGHSVLHPNANTSFFKAHTLFSVSKMETEANRFMIYLTISDDELLEYSEFPMSLLADVYGVPMDLTRWRYEQLEQ